MFGIKSNHRETGERNPEIPFRDLTLKYRFILCVSEIRTLSVNLLRLDALPISGFKLVTSSIPDIRSKSDTTLKT
jgi:hypothetical protein